MTLLPQSEAMRRNMVDSQLRTSGVNTPWILAAMRATLREDFVPGDKSAVYMDRSIPLGNGRMLNPPLATGQMLQVANPGKSDRVLLIGSGTGYMASLLAGRVASLVVVEESPELAAMFRLNMPTAKIIEAAHAAGSPDNDPYDIILIDGGIEFLPPNLVAQMVEGGRLVCGLIEGPVSRLATGIKRGDFLALRAVSDMGISPLPGFSRAKEFIF